MNAPIEPQDTIEQAPTPPLTPILEQPPVVALPTPVAPVRPALPGPGLFKAIGWLIVVVIIQTVAIVAGVVVTRRTDELAVFIFSIPGIFLAVLLIVGFKYGGTAREKLALRPATEMQFLLLLLMSTPLLAVIGETTACLADVLRWAEAPAWSIENKDLLATTDALRQYDPWSAAVIVLVFCGILPGVGEELLFRGFLGRGLVARWGWPLGILLTSLLFAAIHLHPLHMMIVFPIGILLHVIYRWTRSLLAPMFLHTMYNFQVFSLNILSRGTEHDLAADEHLSFATTLTAIFATVGFLLLLYRSRVQWVQADGTEWSPGFPSAEMPTDADVHLGHHEHGQWKIGPVVALAYLLFLVAAGWELTGDIAGRPR